MDRGTRNLFALVLVAVIAVTAAAAFLLGGSSLIDPGAPANATAVDGVIVAVRSEGLDQVKGFDLRTTNQGTLAFTLGDWRTAPNSRRAISSSTRQPRSRFASGTGPRGTTRSRSGSRTLQARSVSRPS